MDDTRIAPDRTQAQAARVQALRGRPAPSPHLDPDIVRLLNDDQMREVLDVLPARGRA